MVRRVFFPRGANKLFVAVELRPKSCTHSQFTPLFATLVTSYQLIDYTSHLRHCPQ